MLRITGTLIWYYYVCKREVWLMAHELHPNQEDPFLEIGRLIQKESYAREKKEIELGHIKIDLIKKADGEFIVGEIKKSSRFEHPAIMQLAYYLYCLRQYGISATGELLIPKEKKRIKVELSDAIEVELKHAFTAIKEIIKQEKPPLPQRTKYCSHCAYKEFCWA
ncbi:MAG TPA: CRISPR-associated protein Cas4 [Candidatus Desulfofervidus auxilii]|uniref:CRISPR-associated exonuclease Cas4 n=1 Tax=Desulfofervidus auxilii TaxID=1621989 RepID=A0A7C2AKB5_DESA2|nr:CRISPR-associated protein Cas4 [Candidatus Desulfofervidus auxilii]